jgi:hypothetical protein
LWVNTFRWNQPGVVIGSHDDVPSVMVDVVMTGRAEQSAVLQTGFATVDPMHDVVRLAA